MLHNPATPDARDEDRLRAACDEARARVAADPSDERAASDLTAAVRAFEAAADSDVAQVRPVHPKVRQARQLIAKGELESAEILMREHLKIERNDPPAMHVMGEIAARCGLEDDAQRIFKRSA